MIILITLLAYLKVIPISVKFMSHVISVQDLLQAVSTLLLFAAAIIYFKIYLRSRSDLSYWCLLGLCSLAFGSLFISQGPPESLIAWTGRISQYFGNLCFLLAVIRNYRQNGLKNAEARFPQKLADV
jgi:hypothetical protein